MLSSLKNKYQDIMGECYDNTKLGSSDTEIENDYIEPTNYRISTMTLITSFTCYINLEVVSKYFKLDDKVVSMVYGDKPVKNSKQKGNRPFFNQATIIVKLDPLRKVNVKIFSNGKIQMTGVKQVEDGHEALKLIIEKLKKTKGIVPFDKVLDTLKKTVGERRSVGIISHVGLVQKTIPTGLRIEKYPEGSHILPNPKN